MKIGRMTMTVMMRMMMTTTIVNDDDRDEDFDNRCGCCHDAHDRPHGYDDDGMIVLQQ